LTIKSKQSKNLKLYSTINTYYCEFVNFTGDMVARLNFFGKQKNYRRNRTNLPLKNPLCLKNNSDFFVIVKRCFNGDIDD
jgi:hypothetical protein